VRRNRSGSLGEPADKTQNNVAATAAKQRHRRSRSRVEGRAAADEIRLSADVTEVYGGRRERRSSNSTRDPSAAPRQPSIPAPCGGLADRSPTPRVAPLDLTRPRQPPNWVDDHSVGDEPGAGDGGAPKSGGRKSSLLDKMANLLLSPGRRQRDGESAPEQTATATALAVGGSRSQQGSRRPSNSSLSDGGDSAPVAAQLSDSAGSNKTRTPRERGRKDSAAAAAAAAAEERNQAGAGAERSRSASGSGDDVAAAAISHGAPPALQQAEPAKRESGGIGGSDTTDESAIAPKRRAVIALRKRFNTGNLAATCRVVSCVPCVVCHVSCRACCVVDSCRAFQGRVHWANRP
jgi:hypothetical protein